MKYFIELKSLTAANHAHSTLHKLKISCQVTKRIGKNGCVFGIITNENPDKLCRMLALHGISCLKYTEGDG